MLKRHTGFRSATRVCSHIMSDSEQLPDDVPDADAAEQHRAVREPDADLDASIQPASELPLEVGDADWQEQLETVDIDSDEFDQRD